VPIRLDDLLASFRRHLRAAAKAPRTIELYSQSVRYFTRWLADRGRGAAGGASHSRGHRPHATAKGGTWTTTGGCRWC
jgi:hypothetical protein